MNNAVFIAWRSSEVNPGRWGPVARVDRDGGVYRFVYTRGAQTLPGFQPFVGMRDLNEVYESDELFPLLANRVFGKSRPEYEAFLSWSGFDPRNAPDPLVLLGVTEGRRQTDSVEVFPCPQPDASGCYLNKFFLHGVSRRPPEAIKRISRLLPDEPLKPAPEPTNEHDPHAVAVYAKRWLRRAIKIGYVPRYLAQDVAELRNKCGSEAIELKVERVNPSAPFEQRVLCRMNACWPNGFRPCSKEEFQPIVDVQVSIA